MIIRSCLGFLDPLPHIWQRSQKFQIHIIESGEVVKPLATLATLTNLPENDAHNWKWRGCQNSGNLGTSDKLATEWCTLYLLMSFHTLVSWDWRKEERENTPREARGIRELSQSRETKERLVHSIQWPLWSSILITTVSTSYPTINWEERNAQWK